MAFRNPHFEAILKYGQKIETPPPIPLTSAQLNDLFDQCTKIWSLLGGEKNDFPDIVDPMNIEFSDIHKARSELLNIKLLSEKCAYFVGSDIEYFNLRIRSYFKFNVPLRKILYLFGPGEKPKFTNEKYAEGLCLHDFDSIMFHENESAPQNFKRAYLGNILDSFTGTDLYTYFPIFKYDETIEGLSRDNIETLLTVSRRNIDKPNGFYPLLRYLSIPNLINHFEIGVKWIPADIKDNTKRKTLNSLLHGLSESVKTLTSSNQLDKEVQKILHFFLRRIFFDIGSTVENEQFLIELTKENNSLVHDCLTALENYEHSAGIEIFPVNLLESEPFLFAMFAKAGLADSRCFLPIYFDSVAANAGKYVKSYQILNYFAFCYAHLVISDFTSVLSRVIFCTSIAKDCGSFDDATSYSSSMSQIGTFMTPYIYHMKNCNLISSYTDSPMISMVLDSFNLGIDLNLGKEFQQDIINGILKLISIFLINKKVAQNLVDSLEKSGHITDASKPIIDSILNSLDKASKMPRPSYWFIPFGVLGFFGVIAFWILMAKYFQKSLFVHVDQTKLKVIAENSSVSKEDNFIVLANPEEEQQLLEAFQNAPEFVVE